jgi:hypothetical protein
MYVIGSQVINIVIHPDDRPKGGSVILARQYPEWMFNHRSVILTQNLPNNICELLSQTHLSVIHPFVYGNT